MRSACTRSSLTWGIQGNDYRPVARRYKHYHRKRKKTHLFDRCRISTADYTSFIRGAAKKEKYDIIFLDPPYNTGLLHASLKALHDAELFAPGAYIVCETDCDIPSKATRARKDEEITAEYIMKDVFGGSESLKNEFEVIRSTLYGRTRITLLTPNTGDDK